MRKKALWLDDKRNPRVFAGMQHIGNWAWVKTAQEAIAALQTGEYDRISLDHDLGDEAVVGSGYTVAKWIEEEAFFGRLGRLEWAIHSMNPVGRARMGDALLHANEIWDKQETEA